MNRRLTASSVVRVCQILLAVGCLLLGFDQAQAQFVYVNNETNPNMVSAFRRDGDGTLMPVPGSPFPTGGQGGHPRLSGNFSNATTHATHDFLFVCNTRSNTVSVFAINPDGSLTMVEGSPFATGGRLPTAVAANPQGTLLFVNNHDTGNLSVFTIASDGALSSVPGSPFELRPLLQPVGLAVNSTGTMLIIGGQNRLAVYRVDPAGQIMAIGGPVETESGGPVLAMTSDDHFVYAAGPDADGIAGFELSQQGQLTPLSGSPFRTGRSFLALAMSPSGSRIAATTPGTATVDLYQINRSGRPTRTAGSPFPTTGGELLPICMDPDENFVFAADVMNQTLHVLRMNRRHLAEIETSPFDLGSAGARPSGIAVK